MDNSNIENDNYVEPDRLLEERKLTVIIGFAFLAVWIISMFFLFNQNQ